MASKRTSENKVVITPTGAAAVPARRKSPTKRSLRKTVEVSNTTAEAVEVEVVAALVSNEPVPAILSEPVAAPVESFQDAVARLAYSYWEARGYQGGSPEEDWLRAEHELLAK